MATRPKRNPYGHELRASLPGFGSDISSQYLSQFEKNMLQRARCKIALSLGKPRYAIDLFSGYMAANAVRLAKMGFVVYAIDFSKAHLSLQSQIGQIFPGGGCFQYIQEDVRKVSFDALGGEIDLVTGQRSLHFLRFSEARRLVEKLVHQLRPNEGTMSFSIGATDCKVGAGYKHAHLPVTRRWHPLEKHLGEPIHVTEPLCLYKEEDIHLLFANLDGKITHISRDDFGLFLVDFKHVSIGKGTK